MLESAENNVRGAKVLDAEIGAGRQSVRNLSDGTVLTEHLHTTTLSPCNSTRGSASSSRNDCVRFMRGAASDLQLLTFVEGLKSLNRPQHGRATITESMLSPTRVAVALSRLSNYSYSIALPGTLLSPTFGLEGRPS